jgi:fatty-acid peroxygenase
MNEIPTIGAGEAIQGFLAHGYNFITRTCRNKNSKVFQTRFMGQSIIFMYGAESARLFYDTSKFTRKNAVPKRIQKTLVGQDGVQTLDGNDHRRRKELFMSLMSTESIKKLMALIGNHWTMYIRRWEKMQKVNFFLDAQEIFLRAACAWVGVPLQQDEVRDRANDLYAMVDGFGAIGPRHWRAKSARKRSEHWIINIIEQYREGTTITENTPLHAIASFSGNDLQPLDSRIAAVEIINLLRPIVAISTYVSFAGLAMHEHPEYHFRLKENVKFMECFVQEVRRYYPFAPFTGARTQTEFEWNGYLFPADSLVFLDLYGTNHDESIWDEPAKFYPERFYEWDGDPFTFIPQGGGDYLTGHRCAGESITIEAMKVSVLHLTQFMTFEVPDQNLAVDLQRIPTFPADGFVIANVKATETLNPVDSISSSEQIVDS